MWESFRELLAGHMAAKTIAEQFIGEVQDEPYTDYKVFTEPVTGENVYHARGADEYDLVIPHGVLSAVFRRMPWALQHFAFNGVEDNSGIFIEFSQKGEWRDVKTSHWGEAMIFKDVWPKEISNFDACERVEEYRIIIEQFVKDAVSAEKKANEKNNKKKKSS